MSKEIGNPQNVERQNRRKGLRIEIATSFEEDAPVRVEACVGQGYSYTDGVLSRVLETKVYQDSFTKASLLAGVEPKIVTDGILTMQELASLSASITQVLDNAGDFLFDPPAEEEEEEEEEEEAGE